MTTDVFDPVLYSLEENAFLVTHIGEMPETTRRGGYPPGVKPAAIEELLEHLYRLERSEPNYCGHETVKAAAQTYLAQHAKWTAEAKRGAPALPSMHAFDALGRPHRGGVGSDSGHVRTYFDEQGNRHRLAVDLIPTGQDVYRAPWVKNTPAVMAHSALIEDADKGKLECPICGFTQTYEPGVTAQRSLAKARVMKHLRGAPKEPDAHRSLLMHLEAGVSA